MSQVHKSSDEQSSQKVTGVLGGYFKALHFRHTICNYRCIVLFAIATVTAIVLVANTYLDLAQLIPLSYQSLVNKFNQGNESAVNTPCPKTGAAVAAVDLSKLPPLPAISLNKTHVFGTALSEKDANLLSTIMRTFHEIMKNASIPYFIYEGALLGSYRHHNLTPWDDDVDLQVHENHKAEMQEIFKHWSPNYTLFNESIRFKFYHESGHTIQAHRWKSPFLDVSFYKDNNTHFWDDTLSNSLRFPKSTIFPLRDRPFLGYLYPAPRDPLANIKLMYNIDQCFTGKYSHMKEVMKSSDMIYETPCSALINLVPFVKHVRGPGGAWCEEVLTFRGQVLNTFIRDSSGIPVC